jgi:hypothetical protein
MRKQWLLSLAAIVASAGLSQAQTPEPTIPNTGATPYVAGAAPAVLAPEALPHGDDYGMFDAHAPQTSSIWGSAEYLIWWVRGAPMPQAVTTTASSANIQAALAAGQVPGAIGSIGTQVLSPSTFNFGPFSGGRITIGSWLDRDSTIGVEVRGFLLESRSALFSVDGTAKEGPNLFIPFVLVQPNGTTRESAVSASRLGALNGGIFADSKTQLWGVEANGAYRLGGDDAFCLTLLAGGRYLDLAEDLAFGGVSMVPGGDSAVINDRFGTRNQFWGANLGARAEMSFFGNAFLIVTGEIALGDSHESVTRNGSLTVLPVGAAPVPLAGGFFVQSSNAGRHISDAFAVVPELRVQVGYDLTCNLRIFAAYDILWLSNVVRPGDQIDRQLNLSQSGFFGTGTLVGPPTPFPQINHTDFFAQGVSIGMIFRY